MEENSRISDIEERTFKFTIRVIKMIYQLPQRNIVVQVVGRQIIRSSSSINSNIVQARAGVSKADFTNHMRIALKEAKETKRWLETLIESDIISKPKTEYLLEENEEIIKILVTIVKNAQKVK